MRNVAVVLVLVMLFALGCGSGNETVYVNPGGNTYHKADCVLRRANATAYIKRDVAAAGYKPCSTCFGGPVESPKPSAAQQPSLKPPVSSDTTVTADELAQIKEGMSLAEVNKVIGFPGKVHSLPLSQQLSQQVGHNMVFEIRGASDEVKAHFESTTYEWRGSGGNIIRVSFGPNGRAISAPTATNAAAEQAKEQAKTREAQMRKQAKEMQRQQRRQSGYSGARR